MTSLFQYFVLWEPHRLEGKAQGCLLCYEETQSFQVHSTHTAFVRKCIKSQISDM